MSSLTYSYKEKAFYNQALALGQARRKDYIFDEGKRVTETSIEKVC